MTQGNDMAGSCIEDHPQRQMIIDALLAGEACRKIADRCVPHLNSSTIWRFRRKVLGPALLLADRKLLKQRAENMETFGVPTVKGLAELSDPVLDRLAMKQQRREQWHALALEKRSITGFAALDSNETRDIELVARLTGRLDSPGAGNVQIAIVIPDGATPPQVVVDVKPK